MGKHDFLTPKAISNRIKSKGLQKLRWYCQICQKQCRDENGFKCHTMSDSHQRQMLIVGSNPTKFMSGYSTMFENAFMDVLRRRHGTKRMSANIVYNEYIGDKNHIHMNSTHWTTLSGFVQYLGKTGKCLVDETEKGWFIQYIDRDPNAMARKKALEKKVQDDLDDEERNRLYIKQKIKAADKLKKDRNIQDEETISELKPEEERGKLSLKLGGMSTIKKSLPIKMSIFNDATEANEKRETISSKSNQPFSLKRKCALESLMQEEENKRELQGKRISRDYWISQGLVVKVITKENELEKYYKKKGVIVDVVDKYLAHVKILKSGDVLQIDQADLQTVIPPIHSIVKLVNGIGRGEFGTLLHVDTTNCYATVKLTTGRNSGRTLEKVEFEELCKYQPHDEVNISNNHS